MPCSCARSLHGAFLGHRVLVYWAFSPKDVGNSGAHFMQMLATADACNSLHALCACWLFMCMHAVHACMAAALAEQIFPAQGQAARAADAHSTPARRAHGTPVPLLHLQAGPQPPPDGGSGGLPQRGQIFHHQCHLRLKENCCCAHTRQDQALPDTQRDTHCLLV